MGERETETYRSRSAAVDERRELAAPLATDSDVSSTLGDTTVVVTPSEPSTVEPDGESNWSEGTTEPIQRLDSEPAWWRDTDTADDATLESHE